MNPYAQQLFESVMGKIPQDDLLIRSKRALEFAVQLLDEYEMDTQIGYFYITKTLADINQKLGVKNEPVA